MEHTEEAGIHSGDSICTIPPKVLPPSVQEQIKDQARRLARRLEVRGLMNVQMAIKDEAIYIIEVNPRASRTVPYVAKAMVAEVAAGLSEPYRTAVYLRFYEGLLPRRIADHLGVPVETVRTRIKRALVMLREDYAIVHFLVE